MLLTRRARAAALGLLFSLSLAASALAHAQAQRIASPCDLEVGQDGKDVIWVPTPDALVQKMLDLAKVTANDYVIDLGSGDGRTVIAAARRGARALGIEYNPKMVQCATASAKQAGVSSRARFMKADIFKSDFSEASVITLFLLEDLNLRLRPILLKLKPGTRVVSNTFTMGDWKADDTAMIDPCNGSWCTALLWIVPANVAGTWTTPQGELTLTQRFQMLKGTLRGADGKSVPVSGKVRGEEISLSGAGKTYRGRLNGKELELH